ncbi:hypothetical protein [Baekduia sp.]|uniref:hypothetical protein n=1 Tax=Baekduia sp. TaxID=2600305 RepID=UPI002E0816AF|nr:hypothetical protein [Baekduia sp.]
MNLDPVSLLATGLDGKKPADASPGYRAVTLTRNKICRVRAPRIASFACAAVVLTMVAPATAVAGDRGRVRSMVLPPGQVPPGFSRQVLRSYTPRELAAQGTWTPKQIRYWGYTIGWEAQYDRGLDGNDPAQLSSDAGGYATNAGARRALSANRSHCRLGAWHPLVVRGGIADGVAACTEVTSLEGYDARVFFVAWRSGRFKGAITLTGPVGRVRAADAIKLARRQAARM